MATARGDLGSRYQVTQILLAQRIPEDADARWVDLTYVLGRLLEMLINHEGMRELAQQPFGGSPTRQNRIYCMWKSTGGLLVSDTPCHRALSGNLHRAHLITP